MQSRTRLQGRWNGIFSLECRAELKYKAGGMDFSLKYRAELDNKACGMEFSWSVTED